jgi:hypothetical protein
LSESGRIVGPPATPFGSPESTVPYLGQFTEENADRVAAALDEAKISWSAKQSGSFMQTIFAADWGVRLFVDDVDADGAFAIATTIAPDGVAKRRR